MVSAGPRARRSRSRSGEAEEVALIGPILLADAVAAYTARSAGATSTGPRLARPRPFRGAAPDPHSADRRLVVTAALVLRLGFAAVQPQFRPYADAADFDRIAVSLVRDGDYPPSTVALSSGPSAFRSPAYPYLLAAVYRLTGTTTSTSRFTVARVLSATLSTLTVVLIGLVALLIWGPAAALTALGLGAIYLPLVTIGDAMLSEPLFIAAMLGAVASTLMARRSDRRLRWAMLAGTFTGAAALTRTNGIILAPVIAAGLWPSPRLDRRSLGLVGAMAATVLTVMAPWAIRNTLAFHQFVPLTTQTRFSLAGTFNDVSRNDKRSPAAWRVPILAPYDRLARPGDNEAALDQRYRSVALDYARNDPGYVAAVAYFNLRRLLDLQGPGTEHPAARESGISKAISDLDVYFFYGLGILAVGALLVGARLEIPSFAWVVPPALVLSLIFVTGYMRYRLSLDPFLILLVAGAFAAGHRHTWRSAGDGMAVRDETLGSHV